MFSWLFWMLANPQWLLLAGLALTVALALITKVPASYNLRNLLVRWPTTVMTTLAFTAIIGLLVAMLGFVNGMYVLTENSGQPGNVMILAEGATDESFSNLGFADLSDLENQAGILKEGNVRIVSRETYLIAVQAIADPRPDRPKRRFLQVRGIEDPQLAARVHNMELQPGGNWFSSAGVRERSDGPGTTLVEVVLGSGIASELGKDRRGNQEPLKAGDTFPLGERTWYVVGVLKSSNSTFDSEVWGKQSLMGSLFEKRQYTTLAVRTAVDRPLLERVIDGKITGFSDAEKVALTEQLLANPAPAGEDPTDIAVELPDVDPQLMKRLEGAAAQQLANYLNNDYKKAALSARVESEYFKSLSQTNQQFLAAIIILTAILSLGGIFGVMNTMFAAISQRGKDIGVLRLLGYRRSHILASFLMESLVLAMIGGFVGCAVGSLFDGATANSIIASGPGGGGKFVVLRVDVNSLTLAHGMLVSLLMGLLGGVLPSLSAMRLTALDALR